MIVRATETLDYLNTRLNGRSYVMGDQFTVVDGYAFIVASWTKFVDISLAPYPNIQTYLARMASRPAVAKVLKEEGLLR